MHKSMMSFNIAKKASSIGLMRSMSCSTNNTPPRIVRTDMTRMPVSDRVMIAHTRTSISSLLMLAR